MTVPQHRRVAVTVAFFAYAVLPGVWAARIPSVQDSRQLSVGVLGLCLLAPALGAVAALPAAGALVARWGRRRIAEVSAIVMAGALPLLAAAPGIAGFVVALVAFGGAGATLDVALNVEAVAVEAGYRRSLLAGMHGSWSLGALAGTAAGALTAAAAISPTDAFTVIAAVVLVVLLVCARLLSAERTPQTGPALAWPDRRSLRIGVIVFCSLFVEATAADWSAVFLHRSVGVSVASAGSAFAAFSAAMVIGRFTGDRLVDRFGVVPVTRWPAALGAVTLLAAVISRTYALSVLGFFVAGAGTAVLFPMGMVAAGRDSSDPPRAIAAAATIGYLGWVLAPALIGGVAAAASLPVAVGTATLFLSLAAGLAGTLRPRAVRGR